MIDSYPPLLSNDVSARLAGAAASTMDRQIAEQPRDVKFCVRCVVSNQRPRITFDDEGVCSACRHAERKHDVIDWDAREVELLKVLERHRRGDGGYDCLVPASGGKDSAFVAHLLKHRYGMNPLTVTWAPFAYTDVGARNFHRFIHAGFDNLTATPNGILHRKLSRLGLDLLGDAWQPFAYGQLNFALQVARRFDVPLVFFGENGEAEYGGSPDANDRPAFAWQDWDRVYLKGRSVDAMIAAGANLGVFSPAETREVSDFYRLPPVEEMTARGIQFHWLGYYRKWVPQENYYYAAEHCGFEANPVRSEGTYSKYASLDDRMDGFHYYLAFAKFGLGRATSDAAHEIRDRHLTREEGVALVRRFDGEFPARHFPAFLSYLGIDEDYFHRVVDRYRPPHLWERAGGEWRLKHAVWHGGTG